MTSKRVEPGGALPVPSAETDCSVRLVVNGVEQDQFGRVQHTTTLRPNGFSNARMLVAVVVDRLGCHVKTLCRKVNHALAIL